MARDITGNEKKTVPLTELRHPEWSALHDLWFKWRTVYEGGQEFIDEFLQRYSKRERDEDFRDRKAITYNPNHAASIINMVRNALAAKLPEVQRTGDDIYLEAMAENVDTFNSSMATFMATELIPLLLAQGKRFIAVDAPITNPELQRTLADDADNTPYIYAINAEDVLSWTYQDTRTFAAILVREVVDVVDDESKLVAGTREQWRYMRMVEEGEELLFNFNGEEIVILGPGVLVCVLGEDEKKKVNDLHAPILLDLEQVPVVEFKLVDSLLKDIGEMQCTLLNLTSSDVSFLYRGNFSIYTEQYDLAEQGLKPLASERQVDDFDEEIQDEDRIETDDRPIVRESGTTRGIGYGQGLERPDFIAPPVENTRLSMEKQTEIAQTMRQMLDLALVSLATKALEQSGKSKEADRIGEEAGLAYIAAILETGERQIAEVFHDFLNSTADKSVTYPKGFSLKTPEQRQEEIEKLRAKRTAVRSPTAAKIIDRRIASLQLEQFATVEEMVSVMREIDDQPFIDDDEQRQKAISIDISDKVVTHELASELRGYPEGEFDKRLVEEQLLADAMTGSMPTVPPDDADNPLDEDTDDDTDTEDEDEEKEEEEEEKETGGEDQKEEEKETEGADEAAA